MKLIYPISQVFFSGGGIVNFYNFVLIYYHLFRGCSRDAEERIRI